MTIAVDFDGTIVTHAYPAIGKPIPFAIDTLKRLQQEDHHNIILWSCREGQLLQDAVDYCHNKGLDFYAVNSNFPDEPMDDGLTAHKLTADLFIDDRNLGGLPEWGIIYRMIHNGQALQPASLQEYEMMAPQPKKKSFFERLFG